jgi:hypothetical protein
MRGINNSLTCKKIEQQTRIWTTSLSATVLGRLRYSYECENTKLESYTGTRANGAPQPGTEKRVKKNKTSPCSTQATLSPPHSPSAYVTGWHKSTSSNLQLEVSWPTGLARGELKESPLTKPQPNAKLHWSHESAHGVHEKYHPSGKKDQHMWKKSEEDILFCFAIKKFFININ